MLKNRSYSCPCISSLPPHHQVIMTISTISCKGPVDCDPPNSHAIHMLAGRTHTCAHTHITEGVVRLVSQMIFLCFPSVILPQTQTLWLWKARCSSPWISLSERELLKPLKSLFIKQPQNFPSVDNAALTGGGRGVSLNKRRQLSHFYPGNSCQA